MKLFARSWTSVLSRPDFIANAGGGICTAVEYHGGTRAQAFAVIQEKIAENTQLVLEQARDRLVLPQAAVLDLARARVQEAAGYRRLDACHARCG
jgi:glutamate dehydrogenase (NAD(P)+)